MTIDANIIEGFKIGFGLGTVFGIFIGAAIVFFVLKEKTSGKTL